jgi:hypothetical protein
MKNKLKILTFLVLGLFVLSNCQKDPDLPMPALRKGIVAKVLKDATKDQVIFDNNMAGFSGTVTVDLYWADKPKSMDLMVSLNDDPEKSVAVVSNITSWPVTYNFTISNLVDILPSVNNVGELVAGDYFRFYANITLEDGTVVNGNDTLYVAYSSGIANLPGSSTNVVYPIACGYDPAISTGSYHSYSAPDQWASAGDITITADPDDNTTVYVTGIEALEGLVEDQGPLVMHIDPTTFEVTADHSVIASNAFGYHNIAYEGSGTYDSCTGKYTMSFNISVDEGDYGAFTFTFTRN